MSTMPPNFARSTPGQTSTAGASFPGGNDDLKTFYMEMARRKMAAKARSAAPPANYGRPMLGSSGARGSTAVRAEAPAIERASPMSRDPNYALKLAAEAEQLNAMINPAPVESHYIGGSQFYTMNPVTMTGAQRQAYLPQNSGLAAPDLHSTREAADNANWEAYIKRSQARLSTQGRQDPGEPAYA